MKTCRPLKWVPWALVGVGLPLLAATYLTTEKLKNDVSARALAALQTSDSTQWAVLDFAGRDATVSGTATSQEAVDAAVAAVRDVYGVRTVKTVAQVVIPPKLVAPTVESLTTDTATPEIKGTWPDDVAKTLAVTVAGTTYIAGTSTELTTNGANWVLKLVKPLDDGAYDITAEVTDGGTRTMATDDPGKITVKLPDTRAPAAPVIAATAPDAPWPYAITGTYDMADTTRFTAKVDGHEYALGDAGFAADGKGGFSFAPTDTFAPGKYTVDFTLNDAAGNVTTLPAPDAIVVPEPPDTKGPTAPALAANPAASLPITGTFDEADTKSFVANVDGMKYTLNLGAALRSDGKGNFTFAPSRKFAPGSYNVDFALKDAAGNATTLTAQNAIVVAEPPPPPDKTGPAAPTLAAAPTGALPLTGTFDEADTKSFVATVDGMKYTLNLGAALRSDGKGNFTFAPSRKFAPGSYNVDFTLNDVAGNAITFTAENAIIVAEPPPPAPALVVEQPIATAPAAPTVTKQLDLSGAPIIKGTWPAAEATGLTVAVNGKIYELGKDANLRSDASGNWSLFPSTALKDGTYDVVATASNAAGISSKDTTVAELEIDGTQPAAPTVTAFAGDQSPATITGTWDEKNAIGFKVIMSSLNVTAELAVPGSGLTSDGGGNWTLALSQPLVPGTYDVLAQSTDRHGRTQDDASAAEVSVVAKGVEVKQPPPYDCLGLLNRVSAVFPMRFDYDTTDFAKKFALSVNQYAAVLKDPRCASITIELGGHADERGAEAYNLDLSARRAAKVLDLLEEAGVAADRLSFKGYGETMPVDRSSGEEAWSVNRRVELNVTNQ